MPSSMPGWLKFPLLSEEARKLWGSGSSDDGVLSLDDEGWSSCGVELFEKQMKDSSHVAEC